MPVKNLYGRCPLCGKIASVHQARDLTFRAIAKSGLYQDGGLVALVMGKHPDCEAGTVDSYHVSPTELLDIPVVL